MGVISHGRHALHAAALWRTVPRHTAPPHRRHARGSWLVEAPSPTTTLSAPSPPGESRRSWLSMRCNASSSSVTRPRSESAAAASAAAAGLELELELGLGLGLGGAPLVPTRRSWMGAVLSMIPSAAYLALIAPICGGAFTLPRSPITRACEALCTLCAPPRVRVLVLDRHLRVVSLLILPAPHRHLVHSKRRQHRQAELDEIPVDPAHVPRLRRRRVEQGSCKDTTCRSSPYLLCKGTTSGSVGRMSSAIAPSMSSCSPALCTGRAPAFSPRNPKLRSALRVTLPASCAHHFALELRPTRACLRRLPHARLLRLCPPLVCTRAGAAARGNPASPRGGHTQLRADERARGPTPRA